MYGQGQRNAVKDHAVAARAVTRIHHGLQSGLNADPGLTHKSEAASLDRLQHDPDSADRALRPRHPPPPEERVPSRGTQTVDLGGAESDAHSRRAALAG
jgi:hypothetical protein